MREILFRGKEFSGDWVYGSFLEGCLDDVALIVKTNKEKMLKHTIAVIPETVGQCTGLTDKNGEKIFEGDIVKHFNNSNKEYDIGVIYFDMDFVGWRRTTQGKFHKIPNITYKLNPTCIYEVIGSIHDNPELLKGGANNA